MANNVEKKIVIVFSESFEIGTDKATR
jgi:hypothetical protein